MPSLSIGFAWPALFAALPLPLLTWRLRPRPPQPPTAVVRIPFFALVQKNTPATAPPRSRLRLGLALLAWLLLIGAAGRPQFIGEPTRPAALGRDLMLAVDISGSMGLEDMSLGAAPASRLQVVKRLAGDFIERRVGDRIGLIVFGEQAYVQTPLTFDRATVRLLLNEAEIGFAGKETALGDAIGLAVKRLWERPARDRALLLLTDGANTAGVIAPLRAAELAAQAGVRIYPIGVGANELLTRGFPGGRRPVRDAGLDEATLAAIAAKTGGRYLPARDSDSLRRAYRLFDELEPVAGAGQLFRPVKELYPWPLAGALLLSVLLAASASKPA